MAERSGSRLVFLDNLRTAMIFLVVLYHAGIVYESSGLFASFWIVDDASTNDVAGLLNVVIDLMAMPAIFFVSGFFALASLRRRAGWDFVTRRLRRLMVPWLVAVLTLVPLYKVIFLYSRGLPQEDWTTYFHVTNGELSQNWLWFLPVLFGFNVIFWMLARTRLRFPAISLGASVAAVFAGGVAWGFGVTYLGLSGWTKTWLFDFQNERLLIYFLVFLLGAQCFRLGVFDAPPARLRLYFTVSGTLWMPILAYLIVLLNLLLHPGEYMVSLAVDLLVLWVAFQLSLLGLLYLLVVTFRVWGNVQGRLGAWLSANSYPVYILHVPVLGAIALLMLGTGIPSLAKYVVLAVTTYAACNLLVHGYRELRARRTAVAGATVVRGAGLQSGYPRRN